MRYLNRAIDAVLEQRLQSAGTVLLEGPRGCGKTETGLRHSKSNVRLDTSPEQVLLANEQPQLILNGKHPRLIDEWQLAPGLWNAARNAIDTERQKGLFIFSSSASPADDVTRHTGSGRFARLQMRPMSLSESGDSSRTISLSALRKKAQSKESPR